MSLLTFLSHPENPKTGQPATPLLEHLTAVADRAKKLAEPTRFENKDCVYYAGLFHDLGKLGPYYQKLFDNTSQMEKPSLEREYNAFHAIYSCWLAKNILSGKMDRATIKKILMMIYCHHSCMTKHFGCYQGKDIEKNNRTKKIFIENWKEFSTGIDSAYFSDFALDFELSYDENLAESKPLEARNKDNGLAEFVELGFLFSVLLQADKGSFSGSKPKIFDCAIDTSSMKNTQSSLSKYRTKFQSLVREKIDPQIPITVINAPTGIGKTKAFLDVIGAFSADRVFYFSPLLALTNDIEQKIEGKVMNPDEILVYSHVYAGMLDKKNDENHIPQWNFDHEAFNEKFIITTTHRLLMCIYSNRNRDKLKLASFANALLIVDEIQMLPKFLLKNLCDIFKIMAEKMNTKVIMVSATVPFELSDIPTIKLDDRQNADYLGTRNRKILFGDFDASHIKPGRNLIMANTRRNTRDYFNQMSAVMDNVFYMSSGLTKKHQNKIIQDIKNQNDGNVLLVSTQVIEAGVDISFENIWRQVAPLDSIVQVLGRLDRENKNRDSTLFVFRSKNHLPYSSLEYRVSERYLENIHDSVQLYKVLPAYYEEISCSDRTRTKESENIHDGVADLDFEHVWDEVRKKLGNDDRDTVYIPDKNDWDAVKSDLLSGAKHRKKKHDVILASLPQFLSYDYFEPELLKMDILLPRKEMLDEIYDDRLGLDKWLT